MQWPRSNRVVAALVVGVALPGLYFALRGSIGSQPGDAAPFEMGMLRSRDMVSGTVASGEHERQMLERELDNNPDHVPVLLRLAQVAREQGAQSEAAEYLRGALAVEPSNSDALLELSRVLWELGDVEGALETTNILLGQSPDNVDALYNLGAIHGNLGHEELARQYWERAVLVDRDSETGRMAALGLAQLSKP